MPPVDAERLRRVIVLYATLAMALISIVVATVTIAPLAVRLREEALANLRHELAIKVLAAGEVLTRARNLAQQVTSRTVIRERLEAHNRGETTIEELSAFTHDKLGDALNLSPELLGVARFTAKGEPVVAVGSVPQGLKGPLGGTELRLGFTRQGDAPVLVVSAPILGRDGLAGTDFVIVDARSMAALVDDVRTIGGSGEAALIDAMGEPKVLIDSASGPSVISGLGREGQVARRAVELGMSLLDDDGNMVLAAEPLSGTKWVLVLRMPASEATGRMDRLLLFVVLGAVVLTAFGVLGLRQVLRPLTGVLIVEHADMARQIAELEQAKSELAAKTRSLALSNAELQEYAYAASHDLQEPVRTIIGFTQLLKRRYYGQMGPEADEFIGFIVEGAERMRRQIHDLLAYARLGRGEAPEERVDMEAAVAEALEVLQGAIAESGARIDTSPLPPVRGSRDALVRLFQNLIGNAIKFTAPGATPWVEIFVQDQGEWGEFVVRDHGIGIEPEYHERIFHMFERLNPRENYEGSGIGLAICRKVVEMHGGRIWVQSRPGEGTEFHFLLPLVAQMAEA